MAKKYLHKDFHGALSYGLEFLARRYGRRALDEYLRAATKVIYRDLIAQIRRRGLKALAEYWRKMYSTEGAVFKLNEAPGALELTIAQCPALKHMRKAGYKIYADFCRQTKIVNAEIAALTGYQSKVVANQKKARCRQRFYK
ncbi:MAG: hypothetical protein HYV35_08395 [Lentisphaerae bacterium]|nr:hypothetical protein [Lentisphaerota bacterium]